MADGFLPRRAAIRRGRAVKKGCRREGLTVQAASSRALRSQRLPPPTELFRRLPRGLVITGTNASPGSKVGGGRKPSHVCTDLGNDLLSTADTDAGNLIQVLESGLSTAHPPGDL